MKNRILFLFSVLLLVGSTASGCAQAQTLDAQQVQRVLAKPNVVLLDVRTPDEFATGHVRGARNLNFLSTDFTDQVAKLDPNATYVVYCASGNRSGKAAALMQQNGFKNVMNAGGFPALKAGGLATE
ncbi:rhodanese-like domain-containing protein [Hymenobacter koreensis]|uniref:Rhodanese domain-containing protein n=1 Tax=Hymenobacter koreensis TaxID=1084523 RepID=A0ABP8J8S1_9BACT